MEQALLNIVRNAADSISDQGSIMISLEHSGKNLISIKVRDTGEGIPAGEEQKIFEPYYTTKEKGTGLGLSIAREIILAHGGEIRVQSKPEQGTTFEILLPRQEREKVRPSHLVIWFPAAGAWVTIDPRRSIRSFC